MEIDCKNAQIINENPETLELTIKLNSMSYNEFLLTRKKFKNDYCRCRLSPPRKPRTTGEKSQNHHLNGHIQQICVETGNSFDHVKIAVKLRAVEMGFPFRTIAGQIIPYSETETDTAQCGILIESAHIIAAELGIFLREE